MNRDPLGVVEAAGADAGKSVAEDAKQAAAVGAVRVDHQDAVGVLVGDNDASELVEIHIARPDKTKPWMVDDLQLNEVGRIFDQPSVAHVGDPDVAVPVLGDVVGA